MHSSDVDAAVDAQIPRNHLLHTPQDVFDRAMRHSLRSPGAPHPVHMLQKLVLFDFIAPALEKHRGGRILEIGCGQGIHSALLSRFGTVEASELETPGSFLGADESVQRVRNDVFAALGQGKISFSHNDGLHLPYEDGSFDVVFHNSVIEHVPDIVAFNKEVLRVLKPGGICVCITGTPALCRFRLFKFLVFGLPVNMTLAFARMLPRGLMSSVTSAVARLLGLSARTRGRIAERVQPIHMKVREIRTGALHLDTEEPAPAIDLTRFHARLYHFIYFPRYNRMVAENIAKECGVSLSVLLKSAERHFKGSWNAIRFAATPPTHGQHYANVWEEMREWRLDRWRRYFDESGFAIDDIRGIRYHHILEATPRLKWNVALYHLAAKRLHKMIDRRTLPVSFASEFLLVARKTAGSGSTT
jgi:ubiquinone/menaquinone biosynthesis C-methylase UbiE